MVETAEKYIQFVANYEDWVAVKKLKVETGMDPRTIMEFLASLGTGIDSKIEANLRKNVDLKKLDAVLQEEMPSGKSEADIVKALTLLNSRKVSAVINELTAKEELQKNEQKELADFCRVYATRKVFKECGLSVDYSGVEIPGMKRLQKTKT